MLGKRKKIALIKTVANTGSGTYCFTSYKNDTTLLGGCKINYKEAEGDK
jgi:hypothetical protein